MKARFWIFENGGDVRLSLKDGQTVSHVTARSTEEGWQWSAVRYTRRGDWVICEAESAERDCDGRLDRSSVTRCHVRELERGYHNEIDDIHYPRWRRVSAGQRDYAAEAAGY